MLELNSQLLEARDKARLKELLAQGADINARDGKGWGILHFIAKRGDLELFEYLLTSNSAINDIEIRTFNGETPLYIAAQNGQTDVARLLIERGADLEAANNIMGLTPLHVAKPAVAELLLEHGANVNSRNAFGDTPLHYVSGCRPANDPSREKAKLLISYNADPNIANSHGGYPIHGAVSTSYKWFIGLLHKHGADLSVRNMKGQSLLVHAASNGNNGSASYLIKAGADVNDRDNYGNTALHWAVGSSNTKLVESLLANGACASAPDNKGVTPLHVAAYGGKMRLLEMLLSGDVDIDIKDENGMTPLSMAIQHTKPLDKEEEQIYEDKVEGIVEEFNRQAKGIRKTISLLLEKGADVNARTNNGETPLSMATRLRQKDIVMLLKAHGAV